MEKKLFLLSLILLTSVSFQPLFGQQDVKKIEKYLEGKIVQDETILLTKDQQSIVNADIVQVRRHIILDEKSFMDYDFFNLFFILGKKVNSFPGISELISSQAFVNAINPNFALKTNENVSDFLAILGTFDSKLARKNKVFKKDNDWCFLQDDWFGELSYYRVRCAKNGKINKIQFVKEKIKIEAIVIDGKPTYKNKDKKPSEKQKSLIAKQLPKVARDYRFTITPLSLDDMSLKLNLYTVNLGVLNFYENGIAEGINYKFIVLEKNNNYEIITNESDLLESDQFCKELANSFTIKNETEAKSFEKIIDKFVEAEAEHKKFYKKENTWCFTRDESFGEYSGVLVLVNPKGKILYIEFFPEISDVSFTKMKLHDPNFKLDYKFVLEEPKNKEIKLSHDAEARIKISFDEDIVNAKNGYIATFFEGEMVGFSASSSMESPFIDNIPGEALTQGKNIVKYALMPSGQRDISKAFAVIELQVIVE